MDSTQAQKLMPVYLTYEDIVASILSDTGISGVIGEKLTLDPPAKMDAPYVFFTTLGPYQRNSDDRQAVFFWNSTDWRLVAPSSWSKQEMQNFMDKLLLRLQEFERQTVSAITLGNNTTAEIVKIEKKNTGVFFDDIKQKGYKSFIYTVDIYYA